MSADERTDRLLQALVEETLGEEQAQALLAEWARDPEQLQEAARYYGMHWILKGQAPADDLCRNVMQTLMEEDRRLESAVMKKVRALSPQDKASVVHPAVVSWRRWMVPLALAASLAIVAGVYWLNPAAGLELRVVAAGVECRVSGVEGGERTAVVGMEIRQGDRVVVPEGGTAVLKYDGEETTAALHSGTAIFRLVKGAKRLKLESGLLVCSVAPQKKPFLLETAHAIAEVVGTRFSLGANAAQTTLAVQEGRVDLHQKDQRLEVSAGETAVADAAGLRKLSPGDAWIRELLVRAETGRWEVVTLGTGVYSNNVWRMDARGGPAERRIWNMPLESDRSSIVSFRDGKRWARGVVVGRMMILPEGQAALEVGDGAATAPAIGWVVHRFRTEGAPDAWQKLRRAAVTLSHGRPPERESSNFCEILNAGEHQAGVWYRFAVYFDMETPQVHRVVLVAWQEGTAMPLPASKWVLQRFESKGNSEVEIGLMAKGVLMVAQGLKFVPLGPDMPMPPAVGEEK